MYICNECGNTKEDLYFDDEVREFDFDCSCGGEYEVASICPVCNDWFYSASNEICDDCFESNALDLALDYGQENKESVEINGYLAHEFTAEQIEEILKKTLKEHKENGGDTKEVKYCKEDGYFDRWVVERDKALKILNEQSNDKRRD